MKTKKAAYTPWFALGGALTAPLLYRLIFPPSPEDKEDKKKRRSHLINTLIAAGLGGLGGGLLGGYLDEQARKKALEVISKGDVGLSDLKPTFSMSELGLGWLLSQIPRHLFGLKGSAGKEIISFLLGWLPSIGMHSDAPRKAKELEAARELLLKS